MRQNATLPAESLTPTQEKAVASLLAGATVKEAAVTAGVDRTTLHRWMKDDFAFQAALNRGRRCLREAMQARLMGLAEKAVATVETAVGEGDARTALALLKGLGLLSGGTPKVGSDDPEELAEMDRERVCFRRLTRG